MPSGPWILHMSTFRSSHKPDCAFRYLILLIVTLGLFPFQIGNAFGQSGRTLRGIVVDANNEGIADAFVRLHFASNGFHTSTDDKGQFEFTDLSNGEYEIVVTARGFSPKTVKGIQVSDKDTERLNIVLEVGPLSSCCDDPIVPSADDNHGGIVGSILSEVDLEGLELSLSSMGHESQPIYAFPANTHSFEFPSLAPGRYVLSLRPTNGEEVCSRKIKIVPNKITKVMIRLRVQAGHTRCE